MDNPFKMKTYHLTLLPTWKAKTQLFQITPKTEGTHMITNASVWTRVRMSRRGGGEDDITFSTNSNFSLLSGHRIPVNKVTEVTLGPGDAIYYQASSAANRLSVAVSAVLGIEAAV